MILDKQYPHDSHTGATQQVTHVPHIFWKAVQLMLICRRQGVQHQMCMNAVAARLDSVIDTAHVPVKHERARTAASQGIYIPTYIPIYIYIYKYINIHIYIYIYI